MIYDTHTELIKRFGMKASDCILAQEHFWVNGGGSSVNPALDEIGGFKNVIMPPWTTTAFSCHCRIDGHAVKPDDYAWFPGEAQQTVCLESGLLLRSLYSPLASKRGLLARLAIENRTQMRKTVNIVFEFEGNLLRVPENEWMWHSVTRRTAPHGFATILQPLGVDGLDSRSLFSHDDMHSGAIVVGVDCIEAKSSAGRIEARFEIPAGKSACINLALAAGEMEQARDMVLKALASSDDTIEANRASWERRIESLFERVPRVQSSNRGLVEFYDRSLLSYLVAQWDLPELVAHPHIATSSLDGGALCIYAWDYSYAAELNPLAYPDATRQILRLFLSAGLFENNVVLPFDGKPKGAWYAYNHYGIVMMIYYYVLHTGDTRFLHELVNGVSVIDWVVRHALYRDDPSRSPVVIDYGGEKNLLELRRTHAYEHFVPSPNAERCWSYRATEEMLKWAGRESMKLDKRAVALAADIRSQLWDPQMRWFRCLNTERMAQYCYSIQIYDMLRFNILNDDEIEGILAHLNEDEFLSEWGVHSLSKKDPGYDPADVDWGGPGVFAGDGPQLVKDLLHVGKRELAAEVLRRILWWGKRLPYYTQAIRADVCDYRRDGRPNVIAGNMGADMLVFGMLGLTVSIDGHVTINPHKPLLSDYIEYKGVCIRGLCFDVRLENAAYELTDSTGKRIVSAYGEPVTISKN